MAKSGKSRRQHPRVDTDLKVTLRSSEHGALSAARIRNVSLGGVFIEMEPLNFGEEVSMTFSLPGKGATLRCSGYVAWSTKTNPERAKGMTGCGFRLTDISVADMRLLSDYIKTKLDGV